MSTARGSAAGAVSSALCKSWTIVGGTAVCCSCLESKFVPQSKLLERDYLVLFFLIEGVPWAMLYPEPCYAIGIIKQVYLKVT